MKVFSSSLFLLTLILCSWSSPENVSTTHQTQDFIILNPNDVVSYSKFEVTNKEYKAFLNAIQSDNPSLYSRCMVDSDNWLTDIKGSPNEPFARNYFSNASFDEFPVVNIPFEGAVEYCKWLSANNGDNKYSFRLPSKSEFLALLSSVNIPYHSNNPSDYTEFNYNLRFEDDFAIDGGLYTVVANETANTEKMKQNKQGAYNIVGNVHEMLSSGEYMGGSWYSFPSEVKEVNQIRKADCRLGFRIVREEK